MSMLCSRVTKEGKITAVVVRADGSIVNLGVIAYHHKNPIRNWLVNTYIKLKDFYRKW